MNDLRLAFRQLWSQPGFALIAILTLGLGIGANAAVFTVINAVLLNPFPYPDAHELMFIGETNESGDRAGGQMPPVYLNYLEWRAQNSSFEAMAWMTGSQMALTGGREPTNIRVAQGTADMWPMLQTPPQLGRVFDASHDRPGAEPVAVLSHGVWQRQFGGADDVLGKSILLDQKAYTVIGVMPPEFKFWAGGIWIPAGLAADGDVMRSRIMRNDFWVVGRLKDGVSQARAVDDLNLIADRIEAALPDTNRDVGVAMRPLSESVGANLRPTLTVLLVAVVCVLLIACVNVGNLLLSRAAARERDFSVRLALGITPGRLLRSVIVENLPLALLGAGVGLAMAYGGLQVLLSLLPADTVPSESRIQIDGRVLGFALLLAVLTTLAFGVLVGFSRNLTLSAESLRKTGAGGSPRQRRLRAALVIVEVALALALMISAGLLIGGLRTLQDRDPGFDSEGLLVLPIVLNETRYPTGAQATQFFAELTEKLRAVPDVVDVAASFNMPLMNGSGIPMVVDGKTYTDLNELPGVQMHLTMHDFIGLMGLDLKLGRSLSDQDRRGAPAAIVLNEAAVKEFLGDGDPIGKRVLMGIPENLMKPGLLPEGLDQFWWSEVVGVVSDTRHFGLNADPPPAVYLPVDQTWDAGMFRRSMFVVMRTRGEPMTLAPQVRQVLWSLDPDQSADGMIDMPAVIYQSLGQSRFNSVLLGAFALLALTLSAIGIFGVVSWHVAQRAREISVCMALGAQPRALVGAELKRGLWLIGSGIVVGWVLAAGAGRALSARLPGIESFNLPLFVGVAAALAAIALLASWWPAQRVLSVDPMTVLRSE